MAWEERMYFKMWRAAYWAFFGDTYPSAGESIPRDMQACLTTIHH
jgi:hypothetical protein